MFVTARKLDELFSYKISSFVQWLSNLTINPSFLVTNKFEFFSNIQTPFGVNSKIWFHFINFLCARLSPLYLETKSIIIISQTSFKNATHVLLIQTQDTILKLHFENSWNVAGVISNGLFSLLPKFIIAYPPSPQTLILSVSKRLIIKLLKGKGLVNDILVINFGLYLFSNE